MRDRIDCCRGCEDRFPGCAGSCDEYKKQRAELDESKAVHRRKREAETYLSSAIVRDVNKRANRQKKTRGYGRHTYTE